jgi:hypothetical protein
VDRKFFREAPVARDIAHRIAETLRQHCTHHVLPTVALEAAGLTIPDEVDDRSKRDRVLGVLSGKSAREHGEIARRLGAHFGDFDLEESGLAVLEEGAPR